MLDATALLWRLHLRGVDVGNRWSELADAWEKRVEDGYYVFNDMHAMMAFVGSGREVASARPTRCAAPQRSIRAARTRR